MSTKTLQRHASGWGISPFDQITGGIPSGNISVLETPDHHSGAIALAQFLYRGLKTGEKAVLITFDTPVVFLENFRAWGIDFDKYIENESFYFLNYKSTIANEIGLTHDYGSIFDEIARICGGALPTRIAFHQVDTLISLSNLVLINACAQKFALSAAKLQSSNTTVLGQFVQFGDHVHHDLAVAFQKTLPGYFSLTAPDLNRESHFEFFVKKLPWFNYSRERIRVALEEGKGFVNDHKTLASPAA